MPAFVPPGSGGWGRYQILDELGRGGFGVVYRARDAASGRDVALKVLLRSDPRAFQRFEREIEAIRRLHHPHLVELLDAGVQGGHPFLVTELVDGPSLATLLKKGPLEPFRALELLRDAARALQHAHECGVLHRDLKPENVLVDARGARLVDFGLARLSHVDSNLTQSGALVGTGPYLSPEQARGERAKVGPQSDVYGLGATLYEALTGQPPFVQDSIQKLLAAIEDQAPTPPRVLRPEIPPQLEAICLKCLAKDPRDRYRSVVELATVMQDLLDHPTSGAADSSRRPRWRVGLALTGLALLGIAGGVGWSARARSPAGQVPPATPSTTGEPDVEVAAGPAVVELPPFPLASPLEPGTPGWTDAVAATSVRRVGPWALLFDRARLQVSRGGPPLAGPEDVGPAAAWDPVGQRLLLAHPGGVLAWSPGAADARPLVSLSWRPTSLALAGGILLAESAQGELLAFDLQRPDVPRWRVALDGRLAGAPLALDLDRDGQPEHVLFGTSASRLILLRLDAGTRVDAHELSSPGHDSPLLLDGAGPAEVLVASREGQLSRYAVEPDGLTLRGALDLERALVTPPSLLSTGGGQQVVIGTRFGWLFCLSAQLDRVEWAINRDGFPVGETATADLDQDGLPEVCSAWFLSQRGTLSAEVLVHSSSGRALLELPCGERPFHLAGGDTLPLIGAGAEAVAWGPWTALRPRPPLEVEAWTQLCGGAFAAARELASYQPPGGAQLIHALVDWNQEAPAAIEVMLERDRAGIETALRRPIDGWLRRGDLASARRLGRPLGFRWPDPDLAPLVALELSSLRDDPEPPLSPAAWLILELRHEAPLARGVRAVEIGGGRFRQGDGRKHGLMIGARGRLCVEFELDAPGSVQLHVQHRSLNNHVPGYASYQLLLDGRPLGPPREAPFFEAASEHERVELGEVTAGVHTLEILVLPQSTTLYSVVRLELALLGS